MPKIAIGSAQFGQKYGISNNTGKTSSTEIKKILEYAKSLGINLIDTATSYGKSEILLAPYAKEYKIVTKILGNSIKQEYENSCRNLQTKNNYGLLLHDPNNLTNSTYEELISLKKLGLVDKIGASVYTENEILHIINNFDIDIIQIPINIFDQRLIDSNMLKLLKSKNIEIHARSIFLQGLAFMQSTLLDNFFSPIKTPLQNLHKTCHKYNLKIENICIQFLKNIKEIDYLIIGIESFRQLEEVVVAFNNRIENTINYNNFKCDDSRVLNPKLW